MGAEANGENASPVLDEARVPPCGCSGVCDPALAEIVSPHLAFGETLLWVGPPLPERQGETRLRAVARVMIVLIAAPVLCALPFWSYSKVGPALGAALGAGLLLVPRRHRVVVVAVMLVVLSAIAVANWTSQSIWEVRDVLVAGIMLMVVAVLVEMLPGQFRRVAGKMYAITTSRFMIIELQEDFQIASVLGRPGDPKAWRVEAQSFKPEQVTHLSTEPGKADTGAIVFKVWSGSGNVQIRRFEGIPDLSRAGAIARWMLGIPARFDQREQSGNDPLRLEICPNCAYSLNGLPFEGSCPECGEKYDQSQIILYGWGTSIVNCQPIQLVWRFAAAVLVCVCLALWQKPAWLGLACAGAFGGVLTLLAIRRWDSAFPGPLQVRFSSAGCCQMEAESTSWQLYTTCRSMAIAVNAIGFIVNILPILAASPQIRDLLQAMPGLVSASTSPWLMMMPVVAIMLMPKIPKARSGGGGAGNLLGEWRTWENIVDVQVRAIAPSCYSVALREPDAPDGEGSPSYGVKAMVRCSDVQAAALRARIGRWRERARVEGTI